MNQCKYCGREGRFYPSHEPSDYVEWFDWTEKMKKTHVQEKCPDCGTYTIWRKRKRVAA